MRKIKTATKINLHKDNHAKCPIYEHDGKFYIKANKPNTSTFSPFLFNNVEYSEVKEINGCWFLI